MAQSSVPSAGDSVTSVVMDNSQVQSGVAILPSNHQDSSGVFSRRSLMHIADAD